MQSYLPRISTIILAASCAGCSLMEPSACTTNAVYSINVQVQDATTGAPIAKDARLVVTSGTYTDSSYVSGSDSAILSAGSDRAGIFDVLVRKPGYITWTRSGVEVRADECHVDPVSLTAALSKG